MLQSFAVVVDAIANLVATLDRHKAGASFLVALVMLMLIGMCAWLAANRS